MRVVRALTGLGVGVIFLPILPALVWALRPAWNSEVWGLVVSDPQWGLALRHTLISSLGSTLLALVLALIAVMVLYASIYWQRLTRQLPSLLALPHVAFAVGVGFLIMPSGWIARFLAPILHWTSSPQWLIPHDPYALSLTLGLALKESWFLLWVLVALLQQTSVLRSLQLAQSLGYAGWQVWIQVIFPQLLPKLVWPMVAVLAYSVSSVEMALILAPTTPPPLAVLSWQALSDPDPLKQAQGSVLALVLMLVVGLGAVLGYVGFKAWRVFNALPSGKRALSVNVPNWLKAVLTGLLAGAGWLALLILVITSFSAAWFFPAMLPTEWTLTGWAKLEFAHFLMTLGLGGVTSLLSVILVLAWLESFPRVTSAWLYWPLLLPVLPLVVAQYTVLLPLQLDGSSVGVVWSQLLWIVPYSLLVLVGPYRAFDQRYIVMAKALGYGQWQAYWQIKWRILWRPISAALAVGFAVSVVQYLPTQFISGGRIETITTEAVALSAGGNRRTLAVYALAQALLPALLFALMTSSAHWQARNRRGLG